MFLALVSIAQQRGTTTVGTDSYCCLSQSSGILFCCMEVPLICHTKKPLINLLKLTAIYLQLEIPQFNNALYEVLPTPSYHEWEEVGAH